MADTLLCVVITILVTSLFTGLGSTALRLSISPDKCVSTLENNVQISCVPDGVDNKDKEITMLEISRNDEDPIVFLRDCSNISYTTDTSQRFQAEGYIDKDFNKSYLNLTLLTPTSEDTGIYTCVMYYVDLVGHMKEETSSWNLIVDKIDVKSLESVLTQLKDKISTLEMDSKKQIDGLNVKDSTILDKIASLEIRTTQQVKDLSDKDSMVLEKVNDLGTKTSQEIHDLTDKVTYTTAFSVTNNQTNHMTSSNGLILILPDVIMQQGHGYDVTTGIFTSPRDGLYVFHLVVFANKNLVMELAKNEEVVARLYAYDKSNAEWNQSSLSSVIDLKAGDRVKVVQRRGGTALHKGLHTVFTGYLIKAF